MEQPKNTVLMVASVWFEHKGFSFMLCKLVLMHRVYVYIVKPAQCQPHQLKSSLLHSFSCGHLCNNGVRRAFLLSLLHILQHGRHPHNIDPITFSTSYLLSIQQPELVRYLLLLVSLWASQSVNSSAITPKPALLTAAFRVSRLALSLLPRASPGAHCIQPVSRAPRQAVGPPARFIGLHLMLLISSLVNRKPTAIFSHWSAHRLSCSLRIP